MKMGFRIFIVNSQLKWWQSEWDFDILSGRKKGGEALKKREESKKREGGVKKGEGSENAKNWFYYLSPPQGKW